MDKNLLDLSTITEEELISLLDLADDIKKNPDNYSQKMKCKTLLMMFEKPSLRTRVSFEVGMTQMGGHAIYYNLSTSPLGAGKETVEDTAKTLSRFSDIIMARLFSHKNILKLANNATVPVINALTDYSHPCQILADLQTIREKKGRLKGLKLCYLGDSNNNVTHSLIFGCAKTGMDISVGCPEGEEYEPQRGVLEKGKVIAMQNGSKITVTNDPEEAIKDADIVYTDSWMSYHIAKEEQEERIKIFKPYQVTEELMKKAKEDAIFMNCLPAQREMEQTTEVLEGPQSVIFDEAENRLHAQKALMLKLIR